MGANRPRTKGEEIKEERIFLCLYTSYTTGKFEVASVENTRRRLHLV
jgi:hypothetical protein